MNDLYIDKSKNGIALFLANLEMQILLFLKETFITQSPNMDFSSFHLSDRKLMIKMILRYSRGNWIGIRYCFCFYIPFWA